MGQRSPGALYYRVLSGNIKVISEFENRQSRQFCMKISTFQGLKLQGNAVFHENCVRLLRAFVACVFVGLHVVGAKSWARGGS